ncbi:MAG: hypothetical protein HZC52_03565 [Planctomycetes bacterium]|nr:hypothetical protein [Planctomycetota bacterium]
MIVLRPEAGDELFETVKGIAQSPKKVGEEQRLSISKLFDFIIFVELMTHFIKGKENSLLRHELSVVYEYLTSNDLLEGSAIRRSLSFLSGITDDYKKLNRLFTILSKVKGPKYSKAKDSILAYLKKNNISTKLFIDDIDGFGFEYNADTKAFLEAIVVCCMTINLACIKAKIPFRVIITPPTELFDHANFWNRDKIMRKTIFLRWNNIEKLRNLINKRISAELNIKKRKKRYEGDTYSIDSEKTWKRIFPDKICNRIGSKEDILEYITRHTFYSPRMVLDICTDIFTRLEEKGYSLETLNRATESEWNSTVQDSCEEKSIDSTRSVLDIFSQIYENIDEYITRFEGRPNIWTKNNFLAFIHEGNVPVIRKKTDHNEKIIGDNLISLLYTMGFIGYYFREPLSPPGAVHYEPAFSYLKWTQKRKFDLIAVSPVFYDALNMQPLNKIIVAPHMDLKLSWKDVEYINQYDFRTNTFNV